MEIFQTNGKNFAVFDGFFKGHIETFNKHSKELIINKKIGVAYNITFRMKNTRKTLSDSNSEQIEFVFDSNLSENGYFSEVNFKTQESIQIKLVRANQPEWGKTKLEIAVEYINQNQELFENLEYAYCESVGGRIDKKLEKIVECFKKECSEIYKDYLENGFKVRQRFDVENLASFIYFNRKDSLCNHAIKADINKILTILSYRNNDCFYKNQLSSWDKMLGRYPFYDKSRWNNLGDLKHIILRSEQVEEIDKCIELMKDKRFNDAFKNASFQKGGCTEFEYKVFKEYLDNN